MRVGETGRQRIFVPMREGDFVQDAGTRALAFVLSLCLLRKEPMVAEATRPARAHVPVAVTPPRGGGTPLPRLLGLARPYWPRLTSGAILLLLNSLVSLAIP